MWNSKVFSEFNWEEFKPRTRQQDANNLKSCWYTKEQIKDILK